MVTQIEVINELTEFFKPAKVKINVIRQLHNTQWHDRQEIDMVLGETVAIEVKSDFAMRSVLEGVGQAILNLLFYSESWLAIPYRAVEIAKPILEMLKLESLRVLDWENMELYEIKEGKVVSHKL
jgi:hypothetical protein